MIKIPGGTCSDLCDPRLKMTRRDLLRIGGAGMLGLSLGSLFRRWRLGRPPIKHLARRTPVGERQPKMSFWFICKEAPATWTCGTQKKNWLIT